MTYSCARKYEPAASPKSNTGTTFGWTSVDARFASSMNRSMAVGFAISSGRSRLMTNDRRKPP